MNKKIRAHSPSITTRPFRIGLRKREIYAAQNIKQKEQTTNNDEMTIEDMIKGIPIITEVPSSWDSEEDSVYD